MPNWLIDSHRQSPLTTFPYDRRNDAPHDLVIIGMNTQSDQPLSFNHQFSKQRIALVGLIDIVMDTYRENRVVPSDTRERRIAPSSRANMHFPNQSVA